MKGHPQPDQFDESFGQGPVHGNGRAKADGTLGHLGAVGEHPRNALLDDTRGVALGHRYKLRVPLLHRDFADTAHLIFLLFSDNS